MAGYVRAMGERWTPSGTTLVVERAEPDGRSTLVVVPTTAGAAPTPIAELRAHLGWDLRRNGSTLVVALAGEGGRGGRLATLDLRTGASAWLTPEDSVTERAPVWNTDGTFVYFGRSDARGDLGIFRVRADGGAPTNVRRGGAGVAISVPLELTPDGAGLVYSPRAGTDRIEIFDLASGADRTFGSTPARVTAWRATRPRALVELATSFGTGGALVLWDDLAPTATPRDLVAPGAVVRGADWDPTGTRLVVATRASQLSRDPVALVTMSATGTDRVAVAGADDAAEPVWLLAGIAYLHGADAGEVRLIAPAGGTPRTLYRADSELVRLVFVSP